MPTYNWLDMEGLMSLDEQMLVFQGIYLLQQVHNEFPHPVDCS